MLTLITVPFAIYGIHRAVDYANFKFGLWGYSKDCRRYDSEASSIFPEVWTTSRLERRITLRASCMKDYDFESLRLRAEEF